MSAAAALSRSFGGLSGQRQGIVSILGNNSAASPLPPTPPPLSLRRTLSADMSSDTWQLARTTDFVSSPMKKIASTNELCLLPDEEFRQDQNPAAPTGGLCDTWSAIMSAQKAKEEDKDLSPPYIHPLVRQSKSCLSEKSLEICTESLGSETGSEGFSSSTSSESGDNENEQEEQTKEAENAIVDPPPTMQKFDMEDLRIAKLNSNNFVSGGVSKKSLLPRSFPPPIPSLARGAAAMETLHMRPHRDNGRLVLEAVSCASRNNFRAQREDGRLVLTFVPNEATEQTDGEVEKTANSATAEDQFEVELENSATENLEEGMEMDDEEEEGDQETEEEENKFEREEAPKLTNGMMNYHRLAVIMNKPISRNQTCWPKKVEINEEEEPTMKAIAPLTQSLPPRPPKSSVVVKAVVGAARKEAAAANVAAASSFNAYECCWKSKPMPAKSVLGPISAQNININHNNYDSGTTKFVMSGQRQQHQDLVTKRGDYFVPLVKGCKEPRRSILFWEPYCIATS